MHVPRGLARETDHLVIQIKENISKKFDWYICSEYVRAMETAALLDLDNAHWHTGTALLHLGSSHLLVSLHIVCVFDLIQR